MNEESSTIPLSLLKEKLSAISIKESDGPNEKIEKLLSLIAQDPSRNICPHAIRRRLVPLSNCNIDPSISYDERIRIMKMITHTANRIAFEFLVRNSDSKKVVASLWVALRDRGCQFVGPGVQEEILNLVILALGDGVMLTRKVLTMYILQKMQTQFHTKSAIGHVIQILYRSGCFHVEKREGQSSLMTLKEEYRQYEELRREHDSQIVRIALEAGIRIQAEKWSSLLYGDRTHMSYMQSIIDKLTPNPAPFDRMVIQLKKTVTEHVIDPTRIIETIPGFLQLIIFDKQIEHELPTPNITYENVIEAISILVYLVNKIMNFINWCQMNKGTFSLYPNPLKNHFI